MVHNKHDLRNGLHREMRYSRYVLKIDGDGTHL